MGARTAPTLRQRRLGIELRRLREAAGLTATEAGQLLGLGQSRVSNIEVARLGISPERVLTSAHSYGCADQALIEALMDMAGGGSRHWWDHYRDCLSPALLDLAELEHHASAIRTVQVALLPGLLQTTDYCRTVMFQNIPQLTPPAAELRVSLRIKRQEILYRDPPTPYSAFIHEAALRMQFGGRDAARAQLRHLIEMSERPAINVRVVPFTAGAFPGSGETVLYADGPVPQLDTVQLDVERNCLFLDAPAQLENYRTFLQRFEAASLGPAESRDFIQEITKSL